MSNGTKEYGSSYTISSCGFTAPSGYTFAGWATSSTSHTASYNAGDTYTTDASLYLYAIWYCDGTGTKTIYCNDTSTIICNYALKYFTSGSAGQGTSCGVCGSTSGAVYTVYTCTNPKCEKKYTSSNTSCGHNPGGYVPKSNRCENELCSTHGKPVGHEITTNGCSHGFASGHYYN